VSESRRGKSGVGEPRKKWGETVEGALAFRFALGFQLSALFLAEVTGEAVKPESSISLLAGFV